MTFLRRSSWRLLALSWRSHGAHYYYYYYYYGLKNVCLHISVHLYYFVWLVLCDICAPTAILQRCRRPYYAATATSRRSHQCAFTGQHSHGVCFEHVQSARRRSAFYATSSRSLAMPRRCLRFHGAQVGVLCCFRTPWERRPGVTATLNDSLFR